MMKTVAIATLGCKVNQFESESLLADLEERGYQPVPFDEGAEIMIINTCTVTHRADFQSRQLVRRALRNHPDSLIIVTGCYSQVQPEAFTSMKGVKYLLGNKEKDQIPDLLPLMIKGGFPGVRISDIREVTLLSEKPLYSFHHHTRAFLKIQDGCDARCSYCIVPYARGPSRSLKPELVMERLNMLRERAFKEVVLTGIHIGSYGQDLHPPLSLEELLRTLEGGETPHRIRLTSIEPLEFSPGLISLLSQSRKICPHLHIPIQSGDDEILMKMNRNYDHSFLHDLIQKIHQEIPKASIGADVIVGFPGETEERFQHTYQFIQSLPISYLHVFPYSMRKGTAAAQLPERVGDRESKRRAEVMRTLGKEKRQAFYSRFLHQELDVLIEDRREKETGRWMGLSRNYIPVVLLSGGRSGESRGLVNQECRVEVMEWTEKGVGGRVVRHGDG